MLSSGVYINARPLYERGLTRSCTVGVTEPTISNFVLFFQAEDGIRDLVRSRGLGDVYKRQARRRRGGAEGTRCGEVCGRAQHLRVDREPHRRGHGRAGPCLLYTSDAADERSSVDLGGRRIIKKKNNI